MACLLSMKDISKSFSGIKVLENIRLDVEAGEVHALLGENGAGKSTLIKILGGIYTKDSGTIEINGEKVEINSVADARKNGISIIHQELMMVPDLSVSENIFLGQSKMKGRSFVDLKAQNIISQELLDKYNIGINSRTLVRNLTIAQKQMVEIIRAVSFGVKILVMDEPTSSLEDEEVETMFQIVRRLKSEGIGIIYISHKMSELDVIADEVTVLRDGLSVATKKTKETNKDELVALMVGRNIDQYYTRTDTVQDEVVLEVENLCDGDRVKNASFNLRKGEILGFSGLVGAGRTECMVNIFGITKRKSGTVKYHGKEINFKTPKEAVKEGFGLVPEDRKLLGNFPDQGVRFNSTIVIKDKFLNAGRYNARYEHEMTAKYIDTMKTKVSSMEQLISKLSGGNQQKVLISRWLMATKDVLIMDEPTRGVDVATKADIYKIMNDLAASGMAIIMVSSEMPELINMCDRIVVMSHGYTTGVLNRSEFSQERIMHYATVEQDN